MSYLPLEKDSPFPIIQHIAQLSERVAHKEEIRFMERDGCTTCSYIVAGQDTFDDGYSRECRGIVFGSTGETVSRPLHKFFNINERPETRFDAINWDSVSRIMEKRDGSMIHTVACEDGMPKLHEALRGKARFTLKSKKSFTSDVVESCKAWLMSDYAEVGGWAGGPIVKPYVELGNWCVEEGQTAIFEFTSPTARIVIGYKVPELRLLHVRDNVTGRYVSQKGLESLSKTFDVPLVDHVVIIQPVKEQVRGFMQTQVDDSVENLEGWVIQFENGDMVKLKTKWYMDRHTAFTFLRNRDIAKMVVDESLDDLKSKLVGDGIDITPILEVEKSVISIIRLLEIELEGLFMTTVGKDRKTVALEHQGQRLFGLLMQKYSGKEPDVKEYFRKKMLDELFDLTQINLLDTIAEVE